MKLLLDECVPQRLGDDFPNHDIYTAEAAGLLGGKWRATPRGQPSSPLNAALHDRLLLPDSR